MSKRLQDFALHFRNGSTREVRATICSGLAIHRTVVDWADKPLDTWNITHVKSGLSAVSGIGRRKDAYRIARILRRLADWSLDADTLYYTPGLYSAVRRATEEP